MDYPLPNCSHGAVRGYCSKCREAAADFLLEKLLDARIKIMDAPVDIRPMIDESLNRRMISLRGRT